MSATAGPERRWPWGLITGVLVGALVVGVVVGTISGFVAGIATTVVGSIPVAPDQPLQTGPPGAPVAVEPLECSTACFDPPKAGDFGTDDAHFDEIGLVSTTAPWGFYGDIAVEEMYEGDLDYTNGFIGAPGSCFFTVTRGPYVPSLGNPDVSSLDLVYFLVTHEDKREMDSGQISARLFADTSAATTYLTDLAGSIEDCAEEERVILGGEPANITPLPALDVPDSVAAVGWVMEQEPGWGWRTYSADLQRGNAVVRIQVITDGAITEQQFRTLVESYAAVDLVEVPTVDTPVR